MKMRDDQYFYDDQGRLLGKLHSDGYAYDDEGKFAARGLGARELLRVSQVCLVGFGGLTSGGELGLLG
jgi:hypothetical protein